MRNVSELLTRGIPLALTSYPIPLLARRSCVQVTVARPRDRPRQLQQQFQWPLWGKFFSPSFIPIHDGMTNMPTQNEDCGQMSAWYVFSALGFYPVDPVSAQYVIGSCVLFLSFPARILTRTFVCSPFFNKVTIDLPNALEPLVISSPGAPSKPYIKSVSVNGHALSSPVLDHADIFRGGKIEFEMSATPEAWASSTLVSVVRISGHDVAVLMPAFGGTGEGANGEGG